MNEHLPKASDDIAFLCDDLQAAHAKANPLLALVLVDVLNEAVELRSRLNRLIEAVQSDEEQRRG